MNRIFTLLAFLLLFGFSQLQAQNAPITFIETIYTDEQQFTLAIRASNFINIGGGSLNLNYDAAIVSATAISLGPGLDSYFNFNKNIGQAGIITASFYHRGSTLSLPDNSIIYTISFSRSSIGSTAILPVNNPDDGCLWMDGNYNELNQTPFSEYYNTGYIITQVNGPEVFLPELSIKNNTNVNIPVTVRNFKAIGNYTLKLQYDHNVLSYTGYVTDASFTDFTIDSSIPGLLLINANSVPAGVSLADEAVLFTLKFLYHSGETLLEWNDDGTSCQFGVWPHNKILNDTPKESFYHDGSITQGGDVFINCPTDKIVSNDPGDCGAMVDFIVNGGGLTLPVISCFINGNPVTSPHYFELGSTYVFAQAENNSGIATCSFNVTVQDTEPPIVSENDYTIVECLEQAIQPEAPVAIDLCDGEIEGEIYNVISYPDPLFCEGEKVYTFSYTDAADNISYWKFTYYIEHSSNPYEVGGPVPTYSEIACEAEAIIPDLPTVVDACGNVLEPLAYVILGDFNGCEGTIIYNYTYIDCAEKVFTWEYTYDVIRTEPPIIVGEPVETSKEINCESETIIDEFPIITDACGNELEIPEPVISGDFDGCEGTIVYTYNYQDCAGFGYLWTYTFTVKPPETPLAEYGDPVNTFAAIECFSEVTEPVELPVIVNGCGAIIEPSEPLIIQTGDEGEGMVEYVYTYQDICSDKEFTWIFTFAIKHTTPPNEIGIPVLKESLVECLSDISEPEILPVVEDVCGIRLAPTLDSPVITYNMNGCEGEVYYSYSYEDCAGLQFLWTYTYTVEYQDFDMPENVTEVVACASDIYTPDLPEVYDNCGTLITAITGPVVSALPDCEGEVDYVWTFADCAGHIHSWTYTFLIEYQDFDMPENGEESVACVSDVYTPDLPEVYDNCGNLITNIAGPEISDLPDCEGEVDYVWTFTDCAGNTNSWTYTFNILRSGSPYEVGDPVPIYSVTECEAEAISPGLPVVKDMCGKILEPSGSVVSGTFNGCEGTIIYTYTYTDCAEKIFIWEYTYDIIRTEPPVMVGGLVETSSEINCVSEAVISEFPIINDACGNELEAPEPVITGDFNGCEGTIIYTYHYQDCAGLGYLWTYTFTVIPPDTPLAEYSEPVNTFAEVECFSEVTEHALPVIVNGCGTIIEPSEPLIIHTGDECEGMVEYVYTYQDICSDKEFTWTFTFTIKHTTPPDEIGIPVSKEGLVECLSDISEPEILPVVVDVCGIGLAPTLDSPVITYNMNGCEGEVYYSYSYEDCAGLQFLWTYTYTVEYQDFDMPENVTEVVACASDIYIPDFPEVYDNCGNLITAITGPEISALPDCEGEVDYVWTFTDCAGNTNFWTYTFIIEYQDFYMPENGEEVVACASDIYIPDFPEVYDNCGNLITAITGPVVSALPDCEGEIDYVWTFTDCAGNTNSWTYTFIIEYQDFDMPENGAEVVACASDIYIPDLPEVYDNCGNLITAITGPVVSALPDCEGEVDYVWTFTDCAGNTNSWTYTFIIEYQDFDMPENVTEVVACASDIYIPDFPEVYDNCGTLITAITGPEISALPDCEGEIDYVWTFTDCAGHVHSWTYTFLIEYQDFDIPENVTEVVACTSDIYIPDLPEVYDNCGNLITAITGPVVSALPDCEGEVDYVWTFTDCAGNTNSWTYTFIIEYQDFDMPENVTEVVACASDVYIPDLPEVYDNCGNLITEVAGPEISALPDCEGEVDYVWTFTDCAGNTNSWTYTFIIEYQDFDMPENVTEVVACISDVYTPDLPEVYDNCGTLITNITGPVVSALPDCEGEVDYVWTFTDCAGHVHSWTYTFIIEYQDFLIPENVTEVVACASDVYIPDLPEVYDNCGTLITNITGPVVSTLPECEGEIDYVWTFTDCAGNTNSWTYTFLIEYQDFDMPENVTEVVACASDVYTPDLPEVYDNCGNLITAITGPVISTLPDCEGEIDYVWTFTDCAGNTNFWTYTFIIEYQDFYMPENGEEVVACASDIYIPDLPEVYDNCGTLITAITGPVVSTLPDCEGEVDYVWTFIDCAGNTNSWTYTFIIEYNDFLMPENVTEVVVCASDIYIPDLPEVYDNCGTLITAITGPVVSTLPDCEGEVDYVWTFTDCAGNTNSWTYTFIIEYNDFLMPENVTEVVACASDIYIPDLPEVYDNCGTLITNITGPVVSALPECEGEVDYVWTFTDCAGNTNSWIYTFIILPTTGPELIDPEEDCSSLNLSELGWNLTQTDEFDANSLTDDVAALYTDNCNSPVIVVFTGVIPDENNSDESWIMNYEFTITDICGNSIICYVTYSGGVQSEVPEDIDLPEWVVETGDDLCFGATETIVIQHGLTVTGGSINLIAGKSIRLLPDIDVQSGAYLHAYISDTYCENPTPLVVAKEISDGQLSESEYFTSINELFVVFPNPTSGAFVVKLNGEDINSDIEIFSLTGQRILKQEVKETTVRFDLKDYPNGIYIIRVINGTSTGTARIVKQ